MPKKVKKVLLCSGKIAVDLYREQQKQARKDIAIVRLEQLYPYPAKQLEKVLKKYKNAKVVWVQEEPKNMGAYSFMLMHYGPIECISRKASASPATGYNKIHNKEQEEIIQKALEA
jgi:2-oxoglutarate dehydrogenase E1 component